MSQNLTSAEGEEWLWDWGRFRATMLKQSKDFEVATVECWKYEENGGARTMAPTKRFVVRNFHTDSMKSWLKEPIPTRDGQQPSSGFKMVMVPRNEGPEIFPLTREQMHFNAAFGLPDVQKHSASYGVGACGMFLQSDNSYVFVFQKSNDFASIITVLRYDPQTNVTRGYFHIDHKNVLPEDFKELPDQFIRCSHTLLIPLLAVELTFELKTHHILASKDDLEDVESSTGYGLHVSEDASHSPSDYQALIRKLGRAQSHLHLGMATITMSQLTTQFIHQKLQYLDRTLPEECQKKLKLPCQMLDERISFLLSNMEYTRVYDALRERMQSQQTVLFNLIAQSDSLINVSLAKDSREMAVASKQDSSAMKIIALLTTFFLPGTFVASLFAMPLFNWSERSLGQVANRHFWIYWAVTGPLALTIMAGVIAWALWNNRRV